MTMPSVNDAADMQAALAATHKQFLAAVKDIRPRLHRFCTRMCGSVLDGEDVVQDTLAQGFFTLQSLKDTSRLEAWLFRIAHNKCIDFLRRQRGPNEATVSYSEEHDVAGVPNGDDVDNEAIDDALAAMVAALPPMERACVLLKDVLGYRLAEIADVVDSSVGGVKAALHRGRGKLREVRSAPGQPELAEEERTLLEGYIDAFNRRDWDAVRQLIQADARVVLVGVTESEPTTYFRNYSALPWEWRFSLARVDGEPLAVLWRKDDAAWVPHAAIRVWWRDNKVVRIRDYIHVDYLLRHVRTEVDSLP